MNSISDLQMQIEGIDSGRCINSVGVIVIITFLIGHTPSLMLISMKSFV